MAIPESTAAPFSDKSVVRFWSHVRKQDDGCWEWLKSKDRYGYGQLTIDKVHRSVHQVAYEIAVGAIPGGLCVLHRCDNPTCVRPDHLFLGTKKQNTRDMMAKGRNGCGRMPGSRNPLAKLTEEQVISARREHAAGATLTDLARRLGVSVTLMSLVVKRKIWRHV